MGLHYLEAPNRWCSEGGEGRTVKAEGRRRRERNGNQKFFSLSRAVKNGLKSGVGRGAGATSAGAKTCAAINLSPLGSLAHKGKERSLSLSLSSQPKLLIQRFRKSPLPPPPFSPEFFFRKTKFGRKLDKFRSEETLKDEVEIG